MWILDQQKDDKNNILVIDSDMESENKAHGAGECSFAPAEEWIEDISWKLEDFIGVLGITIECNTCEVLVKDQMNFHLAKIKSAGHRY